MVFLELWWLRRYILMLWREWPFKTGASSGTSGLLSSYDVHLRNLFEAWQGNRDAFLCETGDAGSLCSCHYGIGIPINIQGVRHQQLLKH